ncbi:acyl-CoA dehydrogenase/oxidase C-terminal [Phyllosticta capitalensis]|uniref:acyl-CoA dehydrogenase/oxidase C-terminal n=1 Tax=Phyllosticta capitalensis TaxID=121624 RepID=UPI00312EB326
MLDFTLSPSQQSLRRAAASFAQTHLQNASLQYKDHSTQPARFTSTRPLYAAAARAGLLRGQIPRALGGTAESLVDAALVVEELFAVEPSAALTLLGTGLGLTPLFVVAEESEGEEGEGEGNREEGEAPLASFVHSEPRGTANWLERGGSGLGVTAWLDDERGEWVVSGDKMWTTNSGGWDGRGAELQCVVCRRVERPPPEEEKLDPSRDPAADILILAITRSILDANPPSTYRVLSDPSLAGFRSTSGPHSRFTSLRVPASHVLCPPGRGAAVVERVFGTSAALVGAMGVGIMRAAFEAALQFCKADDRGGAGGPVLQRQSVADLLIDVKMRCETARLLTWKALHALENGPGVWEQRLELACQAKIYSSEAAVQSVVDAMKAVGITSYATDQPFARLLNDAMVLPLFDGGNVGVRRRQIQKIFLDAGYEPWAATFGSEEQ